MRCDDWVWISRILPRIWPHIIKRCLVILEIAKHTPPTAWRPIAVIVGLSGSSTPTMVIHATMKCASFSKFGVFNSMQLTLKESVYLSISSIIVPRRDCLAPRSWKSKHRASITPNPF